MRRFVVSLLLLTLLLSGCTDRPSSPAPAQPSAAAPAPAHSDTVQPDKQPAPQPASKVSLPQLALSQVRAIDLWAPRPDNPRVRLSPQESGSLIQAVLAAFNDAGEGRPRNDTKNVRLTAMVLLRSGDILSLALTESGGSVSAAWQNQGLYIDSPALTQALAALEPELAKAQKPGIRIWAVDPSGSKAPELLLEQPKDLMFEGASPDGRYLLLAQQLGLYKGDYTAIPYLLDRTTGKLAEGPKTSIRFARWSGKGFYVDWLDHLDLKLNVTHFDQLASALHLKEREREITDAAFSADGKRFAALIGPWSGAPLDLVQANSDGTALSVVPQAVTGQDSQIGILARLALSPDGQYVAITDKAGAAIVRTAAADPQKWLRVQAGGLTMAWAPDSKHVWVGTGGVFDLTGKLVFNPDRVYGLVWQPDGQGGVIDRVDNGLQSFRLAGTLTDVPAPDWSVPAGFLPDGRLLVWRTVHPQ